MDSKFNPKNHGAFGDLIKCQEWPDSSGEDDHGREAGNASRGWKQDQNEVKSHYENGHATGTSHFAHYTHENGSEATVQTNRESGKTIVAHKDGNGQFHEQNQHFGTKSSARAHLKGLGIDHKSR